MCMYKKSISDVWQWFCMWYTRAIEKLSADLNEALSAATRGAER